MWTRTKTRTSTSSTDSLQLMLEKPLPKELCNSWSKWFLIGNKIAYKMTKCNNEPETRQETYIPPEKHQQIIDDLRLRWYM